MTKITRRSVLAMGAATGAMLAAPAIAQTKYVIKFSHVVSPTGHPKGETVERFKQLVEERTSGDVTIEVFPNGSLFNDSKVLEAMALGDVQMAAPSLSKFEAFTKVFRVFDLPFIFADEAAVNAFQDGETGRAMLDQLSGSGFKGLAYWRNGMKQLSANKPLIAPNDAKGLRFRIQPSAVIEAQFEALGANPQKIAYPEVYGALQSGVVDGQENTWTNIWKSKFWEVQDGFTESNHGVIDYAVVADAAFWGTLPESLRTELETLVADATEFERQLAAKLNAESRAKIVEQGVEIRPLSAEQRDAWKAAMAPVWDQFRGQIGEDVVSAAIG